MAGGKSESLYFRARPELRERIDSEAANMGLSRAAFIRMLVQQGMGDPTSLVVLRDTYYQYQQVSRRLIAKAIAETNANLERLIDEELAKSADEE